MKRCSVIIGVDKTPGLTPLSAAVSGAKEFGKWAESAGIDTFYHTDENGSPVRINDIASTIKKIIDQRTYAQMIVFFSGHGILKGPDNEQWLLTDASVNPNEAINVMPSKTLARRTGIPHIIFISDTCRSVPNNLSLLQVTGSVIFPLVPGRQDPSDVDIFYATSAGDPALEVREDDAEKVYKGLFTTCLLKGLKGGVPTVVTKTKEKEEEISIIESYKLADYLEQEVPLAAERIKITLSQVPDAIITSRLPHYLSRVTVTPTTVEELPTPEYFNPTPGVDLGSFMKGIQSYSDIDRASPDDNWRRYIPQQRLDNKPSAPSEKKDAKKEQEARKAATESKYKEADAKLLEARGRDSFETGTGFSVIGASGIDAHSDTRFELVSDAPGVIDIRVFPTESSSTLLLILENGTSVPLAILQGFIGTVYVEENRVLNVNYTPSLYSQKYENAVVENEGIRERRARIATLARFGQYNAGKNVDEAILTGSYLRNVKELDPTLGLYAAYSYAEAAYSDGILSIYDYMNREEEPVLYDVALLAAINGGPSLKNNPHIAPFCPMLTQGWAYLTIDYSLFHPLLKDAARYLVPGLWTTFNQEGTQLIIQKINDQTIL